MRFNEICVLGGGEISGSRCDVASSWCLACLCFLHLMVYREFFMETMQMVVAIPLCFGIFCTSLVARSAVQDSYKHRRILGRCYNKCLWGKARMGSAYHSNLLMYFFALRIGTWRLPVSFWVYPLYSQRWKSCESYQRMRKLPKSLSGDLGGQSPKIWSRTSFGPRLHLVRTSFGPR